MSLNSLTPLYKTQNLDIHMLADQEVRSGRCVKGQLPSLCQVVSEVRRPSSDRLTCDSFIVQEDISRLQELRKRSSAG